MHTKILVRLRIGEPAVGAGDEIPPESLLCQRGEARSAGGFVREHQETTVIVGWAERAKPNVAGVGHGVPNLLF